MSVFQNKKRILVVRVGALGDTLMATPVVSALATQDPARQIDFLCSESARPLLVGHPEIGKVFSLRGRNWPLSLSPEKQRLIRTIRQHSYDAALLLESAPRYRNLLDQAQIPFIRSFDDCEFDPLEHSSRMHLRVAGFDDWRNRSIHPFFRPSPADLELAGNLLASLPAPRIGLHCGYGPAGRRPRPDRLKGWPLNYFASLARGLLNAGFTVVLTGSEDDAKSTNAIEREIPRKQVLNLTGKTSIVRLGATIQCLDLFISVDSGPAHLAAAVGTPLIVLWGPAKLHQVRPLENGADVVVLREPVPCAPCYDTPAMKSCRANVCMRLIRPSRVLREALRLLES